MHQPEVVDPGRVAAARPDLVGPLVGDPDAHVLEQRQHVGERERAAGAIQLRAQRARAGLERAIERDVDPARVRERLEAADVADRRAGDPVGAVGRGERVAVALEERARALLALVVHQRLLEVVRPRARGRHEQHLGGAGVDLRPVTGFRVRHVVEPDEHRLGDPRRVVDRLRLGDIPQDRLDAAPVLRVEAVARNEDETGEEAPEAVAANEQAQPLALAEVEDPHRGLEQLVGVHLDQLVARVRLEDLDQGLLVVAARGERGAREHVLDLAAQDRDVGQPRLVGRVRVEPEEAALADDLALVVEALHSDVVEVRGAVDSRARVRLRQVEQVRLERQRAHLRRKLVERARALLAPRLAQDAEPRPGHGAQPQLVVLGHELVVAIAEEGEVVVLDPCDERPRLRDLLGIEAGRRRVAQLVRELEGARAHVGPVVDRGAHLAHDLEQRLADLLEPGAVGLVVDLGVHDRLGLTTLVHDLDEPPVVVAVDAHDGVDQQVDAEPAPVQRHRHRVDQERGVVRDDLERGVRRLPAVGLEDRVVQAHLRLARLPLAREPELTDRHPVEVEGVALGEVLGGHPAEVAPHEGFGVVGTVRGEQLAYARADLLDQGLVRILNAHVFLTAAFHRVYARASAAQAAESPLASSRARCTNLLKARMMLAAACRAT